MLRASCLVVLVFTVLCADAQASSVSAGRGFVNFKAGAGEANDVHVSAASAPDHLLVRDSGAPLESPGGCVRVDEHTQDCTVGPSVGRLNASLQLGDGNDRAIVDQPTWSGISGGEGDDQLTGCQLLGGD